MSTSAERRAAPTPATWVFGYGSLAAPSSIARTIGRLPEPGVDYHAAHLDGYGRRWNYGSLHLRGDWNHDGEAVDAGLVVSLGLIVAPDERCHGAVFAVDDAELGQLDWRERDYERTDVTAAITSAGVPAGACVVTYVPRPSAIERYETARDRSRAAVRRSYWELVHDAFDDLGDEHGAAMRSTPPPDVPVVDIELRP